MFLCVSLMTDISGILFPLFVLFWFGLFYFAFLSFVLFCLFAKSTLRDFI